MAEKSPNSIVIENILKELEGIETGSTIEIGIREMDSLASMFMKKSVPFYCIRARKLVDGERQSMYEGYVVAEHKAWEICNALKINLRERGMDTVEYIFRDYSSIE